MDKKKIIKKAISKTPPKPVAQVAPERLNTLVPFPGSNKTLPTNTPYEQLNFKNYMRRLGNFNDKEISNLLDNTTIDTRPAINEMNNPMSKDMTGQAAAFYDPNKGADEVVVLNQDGSYPDSIKHELLHRKFSRDSGQQDLINNYEDRKTGNKYIKKVIPDKYNPVVIVKNKLIDRRNKDREKRPEEYASTFNKNWEKEKNMPMSSRKINKMKSIDDHINKYYGRPMTDPYTEEENGYYLPPSNYSKATERNSYFNQ